MVVYSCLYSPPPFYSPFHSSSHLGANTLALEEALQVVQELKLFRSGERHHHSLHDRSNRDVLDPDHRAVVDIGEQSHKELAVHAVSHASVAGDGVAKVLDVESTLEARCEEATEGSDERRESGHDKHVEEEGREGDGGRGVAELMSGVSR